MRSASAGDAKYSPGDGGVPTPGTSTVESAVAAMSTRVMACPSNRSAAVPAALVDAAST